MTEPAGISLKVFFYNKTVKFKAFSQRPCGSLLLLNTLRNMESPDNEAIQAVQDEVSVPLDASRLPCEK